MEYSQGSFDFNVRMAAFRWIESLVEKHGSVLDWTEHLKAGFFYGDERIHVLSQQGIFKPQQLDIPLSIRTSISGPYEDSPSESKGAIEYKFRGIDPNHRDNIGLRTAWKNSVPLIYFWGIDKGKYIPIWPVFIVGEDKANLSFFIQAEDYTLFDLEDQTLFLTNPEDITARRKYITTIVEHRAHQAAFRNWVLKAYKGQCSICKLKHTELLDAAHIIPDKELGGEPIVPNGMAMCKLHHAAFDKYLIGVTPDYEIRVREDILDEEDGPTLKYSLQGIHEKKIILPGNSKNWPSKEKLDWRYERFQRIF